MLSSTNRTIHQQLHVPKNATSDIIISSCYSQRALQLYRTMLREASGLSSYNVRFVQLKYLIILFFFVYLFSVHNCFYFFLMTFLYGVIFYKIISPSLFTRNTIILDNADLTTRYIIIIAGNMQSGGLSKGFGNTNQRMIPPL